MCVHVACALKRARSRARRAAPRSCTDDTVPTWHGGHIHMRCCTGGLGEALPYEGLTSLRRIVE
eukprot:6517820-Prymnesium_polylepis.1